MKISTFPEDWVARKQQSRLIDSAARTALFRVLEQLEQGRLVITENDETREFGNPGSDLEARVVVTNPAAYRMVLLNGSIGAGEAYMSGCWHSPDLTRVIQVMCRNMNALQQVDGGISKLMGAINRLHHMCIPNSLSGSRRNIQAHYDLSNDLFETFLDEEMMYSSAVYPRGDESLEDAQIAKLEAVAQKLDLDASHSVVEIGTGWGGMAIYLARTRGCKVTTTTISKEQYEYARQRVRDEGLESLVTVLDKDYRELTDTFDRLVSIEMIEAVGSEFLPEYVSKCDSLLKPGGKMVIQAITMPEQRYEKALHSVDFIQKYIFPGGFLPSVESILKSTGQHTRLQFEAMDDIGLDYARTLQQWRERFRDSREQVQALGFDNLFCRLWEFYFCYCEGGFRERAISTVQMVFRRV